MRVTRHEEFEAAHLLPGYDGPCGNLHGHSYKIEVTVEGLQDLDYYGMVLDFNFLKEAIKNSVPDHRFIYNSANPSEVEKDIIEVLDKHGLLYVGYPFDTTAENMASHFAELINKYLQTKFGIVDLEVVEVNLWETTGSHATWRKPC